MKIRNQLFSYFICLSLIFSVQFIKCSDDDTDITLSEEEMEISIPEKELRQPGESGVELEEVEIEPVEEAVIPVEKKVEEATHEAAAQEEINLELEED